MTGGPETSGLARLIVTLVIWCAQGRWGDGSAAQHDPGAHPTVVGLPDGHGIHARPHQRDSAVAVLLIGWRQTPAPVVTHEDRDPTLPSRCCLDSTADLHQPRWLIEIGVLDGVGDSLADGPDDVLELTRWPGQPGKPAVHLVSGHRDRDRVRGQRQPPQRARLARGCDVAARAARFQACWQLCRRDGAFGVISRWHRARYCSVGLGITQRASNHLQFPHRPHPPTTAATTGATRWLSGRCEQGILDGGKQRQNVVEAGHLDRADYRSGVIDHDRQWFAPPLGGQGDLD